MNKLIRHPILKNAFLLTAAGFLGKLIGFYTRIFLVSFIGAEGIGIYQMVFPLYVLCISLASSGLQTAIIRFTAESFSAKKQENAWQIFCTALTLALILSCLTAALLYWFSAPLCQHLLSDTRCLPLLRLFALAIPFETIHACITGYFLGQKKASFSAWTQLLEQILRIFVIVLLSRIWLQSQSALSPTLAAAGVLGAELIISLVSITVLTFSGSSAPSIPKPVSSQPLPQKNISTRFSSFFCVEKKLLRQLAGVAVPISLNRLALNFLQSIEALYIPLKLQIYYGTTATALSAYGLFTGMVLPLLLFPAAITSSLSLILLPSLSEARIQKNSQKIAATLHATLRFCLFMGIACSFVFFLFGPDLGLLLYHTSALGPYLRALAWICPFFYLNTTLTGILHGLDHSVAVFRHNLIGLSIRLAFVFLAVPRFGIYGYLLGLFLSQAALSILGLLTLRRDTVTPLFTASSLYLPAGAGLAATAFLCLLQYFIPLLRATHRPLPLCLSLAIWGTAFLLAYRAPASGKVFLPK